MKTISLPLDLGKPGSGRRLETQILHYDVDTWRAYSYIWNDEQTDATLAEDRTTEKSFTIRDPAAPGGQREQIWRFVSRTECLLCHTTRGGSIYGFNPSQLDRDHDYGAVSDNQLRTLGHIGLFPEVAKEPAYRLVNPHDEQANLETRARTYLHINCAHCHRRGGGGTAAMDVQFHWRLDKTNLLNERPTQGTFNIHAAQVVAAGDPYRSVLFYRMAKVGRGRMPYLGSGEVDQKGLRLMHDWIRSMPSGPATNSSPGGSDGSRENPAFERYLRQVTELHHIPSAEATTRVAELLATTSGALALQYGLAHPQMPDAVRQVAIDLGVAHADIQVRDLFERFVPQERRTKRLGGAIHPQEILQLTGDAYRGRQLFLDSAGVACKNCHQLAGQGSAVGPELTQIGKKYNRVQLLESILEPSKSIEPKFVTYLVETADGQVIQGLLVSRDEQWVVLKDSQAKEVRIPAGDIELFAPQQRSLMPELLLQDMTAQQVADLLEFLASLR